MISPVGPSCWGSHTLESAGPRNELVEHGVQLAFVARIGPEHREVLEVGEEREEHLHRRNWRFACVALEHHGTTESLRPRYCPIPRCQSSRQTATLRETSAILVFY